MTKSATTLANDMVKALLKMPCELLSPIGMEECQCRTCVVFRLAQELREAVELLAHARTIS